MNLIGCFVGCKFVWISDKDILFFAHNILNHLEGRVEVFHRCRVYPYEDCISGMYKIDFIDESEIYDYEGELVWTEDEYYILREETLSKINNF